MVSYSDPRVAELIGLPHSGLEGGRKGLLRVRRALSRPMGERSLSGLSMGYARPRVGGDGRRWIGYPGRVWIPLSESRFVPDVPEGYTLTVCGRLDEAGEFVVEDYVIGLPRFWKYGVSLLAVALVGMLCLRRYRLEAAHSGLLPRIVPREQRRA